MQREHGDKGLVCFTITVDSLDRKKEAHEFLNQIKAQLPGNFLLDESEEFWAKKFSMNGPPCVFVFDRQGKRAGKFYSADQPYEPGDIDKLVFDLLREKP